MNYRATVFLIGILLASCTTAPATATLPPTTLSLPSPTSVPAPTKVLTPAPISLPPGTKFSLEESGSRELAGTMYGNGETVILLANMSAGGQKQWDPFVAAVDLEQFTVITFDYRSINNVNQDIDLLLRHLRETGFARVICIGASLGTSACNHIALEPEIVGLVLVAGSVHQARVAEATYPKLFIAGGDDRWAFDIQQGYEQASEPKTLRLFENTRAHGTDLFRSEASEQFLALLVDFVNRLAVP